MKRNIKKTPTKTRQRRSPRKIGGMIKKSPVKRLKKMKIAYESPLKHLRSARYECYGET